MSYSPEAFVAELRTVLENVQTELSATGRNSARIQRCIDAMPSLAATLRQQAARVDETMVDAVQTALNAKLPVEYLHTKSEVRAALAQNTQGEDYSELGNKYVAEAVERLRLALGELTENAGAIGIISVAAVRIDRLQAERARVPEGMVLVPREPTPEMLAAVEGATCSVRVAEDDSAEYPLSEDECAEIYRNMLAAAPSQRAEVK